MLDNGLSQNQGSATLNHKMCVSSTKPPPPSGGSNLCIVKRQQRHKIPVHSWSRKDRTNILSCMEPVVNAHEKISSRTSHFFSGSLSVVVGENGALCTLLTSHSGFWGKGQ